MPTDTQDTALSESSKRSSAPLELYDRLGFRLLLDRSSWVDKSVIETGVWEAPQIAYIFDLIGRVLKEREDLIFVDLGSYWGLYSLMALRAGVKRIHAFDADRHNFAQLQAQLFLNDAAFAVTSHNIAVSNESKTLEFWDSRTHPDGNRAGVGVIYGKSPNHPSHEVQAVSIDDYLPMRNEVIFMKLDLEGHEAEALQGMVKTVQNNQVVMQIEIFDHNREKIESVIHKLGLKKLFQITPDFYYTNFLPTAEG